MFADVFVGYPLDETFTYRIPQELQVASGMRVKVNFGKREINAFVYRIHNNEPKDFKVKDIISVLDEENIFDDRLIELSRYIAQNYLSTVGETLSLAIPSGNRPSKRFKIPFEKVENSEFDLNEEQQTIYNDIFDGYSNDQKQHLLFGITGSGKTEIYIKLAQYFIKQNKSVIYLVPEITISSQIFERLYAIFGDRLILYHSHLTPNQRLYNWIRFYKGDAVIAIGTRSSVFLQCPDLGMIIVDEEHDGSYKEQSSPRYNARRIAYYRSKEEDALLLFGSATPSVETLYSAERGLMNLHRLNKRFGDSVLPEIEIVPVSLSKPEGIISPLLKLFTKRTTDENKQVIFLLNRRGFAPFIICDDCKDVISCPHCDVSLNYHRGDYLLCHYCGFRRQVPDRCEKCGSESMIKLGAGTQRIEELVGSIFKDLTIYRMDQDSMRKRGEVYNLIEKMNNGEVDILLGTQMVAKGFDFPGVTLVGVLMADIGLNMPDFRASEKIFSLLVQVAGRSGRGETAGKVIVQTLDEEHPIFQYIKNHDYYSFYRSELEVRKMLGYPPFKRMARLLVRGTDKENVSNTINKLKVELVKNIERYKKPISLLGPSSAPLSKIGGNFRYHIILKGDSVDTLRSVIGTSKEALTFNNTYLEIDIDPQDIM